MANAYLSPVFNGFRALDNSGKPISGAQIQSYLAGGSTPQTTYKNAGATDPNTNPIISDSSGRFQNIFLGAGLAYDLVLKDQTGAVIQTIYGVTGVNDVTVPEIGPSGIGTVTLVNATGGDTGLTFTGGPITTSGTLVMSGVLNAAHGGAGGTTPTLSFDSMSPLTTKGDLIGYTNTNTRIPVGTNGQVLAANSGSSTGVSWATISVPTFGQTIYGSIGTFTGITPINFVPATPLISQGTQIWSQAITPVGSGSKVKIEYSFVVEESVGLASQLPVIIAALFRGSTCINSQVISPLSSPSILELLGSTNTYFNMLINQVFIDSPSTSGSVTYSVRLIFNGGAGSGATGSVNITSGAYGGTYGGTTTSNYILQELL